MSRLGPPKKSFDETSSVIIFAISMARWHSLATTALRSSVKVFSVQIMYTMDTDFTHLIHFQCHVELNGVCSKHCFVCVRVFSLSLCDLSYLVLLPYLITKQTVSNYPTETSLCISYMLHSYILVFKCNCL